MPKKPDNIFYEDAVSKAIMFKTAEKLYGVKPNAIGDMRYITVPYSVALLHFKTGYKIDLYKIWKKQSLSENLKTLLFNLMEDVESFIKNNAPGSLYGEWAKKEECWVMLKESNIEIQTEGIKSDFFDSNSVIRKSLSGDDVNQKLINQELALIKSISADKWKVIEQWGANTGSLSQYQQNISLNISVALRNRRMISDKQRQKGISIIELVVHDSPELLESEPTEVIGESNKTAEAKRKVDNKTVLKMIEWDSRVKILSDKQRSYLTDFAYGLKKINGFHEKNIRIYLEKLIIAGFND
jgi:mRNA-degrading endonuclease YafQ of YafQ-DinJ toxin-antitoxin module